MRMGIAVDHGGFVLNARLTNTLRELGQAVVRRSHLESREIESPLNRIFAKRHLSLRPVPQDGCVSYTSGHSTCAIDEFKTARI